MTPERWERIKRLYHDARDRHPGERVAFLAAACPDDADLRREVQHLLDQPVSSTGFVDFVGGRPQAPIDAGIGAVPLTGRRAGVYDIGELLGKGGMGEVYRAHDTRLRRDVAIKVLPLVSTFEPDRLERFEREARMLAALNHPHVGAIYGVEEVDASDVAHQSRIPALVLELVEGETLADRIRRGPVPIQEAITIARQIADALGAAHASGIVHRDLKPANIKITPAGVVKVLDFGLAKAAGAAALSPSAPDHAAQGNVLDDPIGTTRVGAIIGTTPYMSPEQARGEAVDHRTDIWAFGCVVHEMLAGRPAFLESTAAGTLAAVLEREPAWTALPAATPPRLLTLLRRCLEKDAAERLDTIEEARRTLQALSTPVRRPVVLVSAATAAVIAIIAGGVFVWMEANREPIVDPSRWVQLTAFPDSATQPALSPDGQTLAFIRGPNTFTTSGQIYVKPLPAGQAVPLTGDDFVKMSPVFSPDASRIAYTVNSHAEPWATWIVPVRGGTAERYMANASGLTWTPMGRLLFSALKPTGPSHMAIVMSDEKRAATREVFAPPHTNGMAHRSALSPDGRWVMLAEMDERGVWTPCRLVPADGGSRGTLVGPAPGRCTDVAWAPDGRTMYFTADAGDGFHLWRQRFPDGDAEQITRGPTAEEGLAIAPDGQSVITSVGLRRRGIWIRDASGERQLSGEGYAFWPLPTRDGRSIVYRLSSNVGSGQTPTELWKMDVASGRTERLLPGLLVTQYDLSADNRIVAAVSDRNGRNHLWLASVDASVAPRPIPGAEGDNPRFIARGDITFRVNDGSATHVVRIRENGDGRTRLVQSPGGSVFGSASPDGEWLSANSRDARGNQVMTLFSMSGEHDPVPILGGRGGALVSRLRWAPDGTRAYLSVQLGEASAFGTGRTYVLPLRPGSTLPAVPPGGFQSESELAAVPGVEILPLGDVALGPSGTYVFSRETVTRNLYRIPLP